MKRKLSLTLLAALFIIGVSSCKKDKVIINEKMVTVDFVHKVNSNIVEMDTIMYTNTFGNDFSVSRLQYFISDIKLHKANGAQIISEAHYIDGKIASTNSLSTSLMISDQEQYTGISFTYGLNQARNIDGAFPNPPENSMEWPLPLGGGYHYMKLEGKHDSSGTIKNFQCHTGPTRGNQYFKEFKFDKAFTIKENQKIEIIMNIEKWFSTPNDLDLNIVTMIMGNEAMQAKLEQNVTDVFTVNIK